MRLAMLVCLGLAVVTMLRALRPTGLPAPRELSSS